MTIRLIVIDDHSRIHQAISDMVALIDDIEIVAQGSQGEEAIVLADEHEADLILMDVIMPGIGGVEATRQILKKHPDLKILALSSFQDYESIREMLESGAIGYVLKQTSVTDLENTIRTAAEGKAVFSTEVTQMLLQGTTTKGDFGLTAREKEILQWMAEGLSNSEIGYKLSISVSTVKFHVTNILSKMSVESRVEAVSIAVKNNLV